jgi:hypothetical protein
MRILPSPITAIKARMGRGTTSLSAFSFLPKPILAEMMHLHVWWESETGN